MEKRVNPILKYVGKRPERSDILAQNCKLVWRTFPNDEALAAETHQEREITNANTVRLLVRARAGVLPERALKIRKFSHDCTGEAIA